MRVVHFLLLRRGRWRLVQSGSVGSSGSEDDVSEPAPPEGVAGLAAGAPATATGVAGLSVEAPALAAGVADLAAEAPTLAPALSAAVTRLGAGAPALAAEVWFVRLTPEVPPPPAAACLLATPFLCVGAALSTGIGKAAAVTFTTAGGGGATFTTAGTATAGGVAGGRIDWAPSPDPPRGGEPHRKVEEPPNWLGLLP